MEFTTTDKANRLNHDALMVSKLGFEIARSAVDSPSTTSHLRALIDRAIATLRRMEAVVLADAAEEEVPDYD